VINIKPNSYQRSSLFVHLFVIRISAFNKYYLCTKRAYTGNACYHLVQNLLSASLLSKNIKIKIYRTIILPDVLCGCETWSFTLKEEPRLRVFKNRVLRRIFGPKRDKVIGEWRRT